MARLIACPACDNHNFANEAQCRSCGQSLRATDGSLNRTATAVLLGLTLTAGQGPADGIMAFFCLTLMAGALIFWSVRARALSDLAALPAAGFIARLALVPLVLLHVLAALYHHFWLKTDVLRRMLGRA